MEGVPKATAEEAFRQAAGKLPMPTKVVSRDFAGV
jgi:ribosomal protein L16/L10AE